MNSDSDPHIAHVASAGSSISASTPNMGGSSLSRPMPIYTHPVSADGKKAGITFGKIGARRIANHLFHAEHRESEWLNGKQPFPAMTEFQKLIIECGKIFSQNLSQSVQVRLGRGGSLALKLKSQKLHSLLALRLRNLRPDQSASTAQTFTSTHPVGRITVRKSSSVIST